MLQNNGGNNTPVSVNASFTFSTGLASGSAYAVTVLTPPLGEKCAVANGSGTVATANVSVAVTCTPNPYSVGGSVGGLLPGTTITLVNNGVNSTNISANGAFTFSTSVLSGTQYNVTVAAQPVGENCAEANGTGTIAGAPISNVVVTCTPISYSVTASVFGLLPNSNLVLQDNNGDNLTATSSGNYNFKTLIASQSSYSVTVLTQPSTQSCFVQSGTGTISTSNVTITVVCPWHVAYVPDYYDSQLQVFYIDPTSGALLTGPSIDYSDHETYPIAAAVTPNTRYLYVVNDVSGGSLSGYAINPLDGSLSTIAGSPFVVGASPGSVSIDPTGRFLYVGYVAVENGDENPVIPNGISAYTIEQNTGVLTKISGSPLTSIPNSVPLAVATGGGYLITAGTTYSIDASTGALAAISGNNGTGGPAVTSIPGNFVPSTNYLATDPSGNFVFSDYVQTIDNTPSNVSAAFSIDPSGGSLTPLTATQIAAGGVGPMVVAPNGNTLYIATNNTISGYHIDNTSGAQTPIANGVFQFPQSASASNAFVGSALAVDPSGKFLYASSAVNGTGTWVFSIDATSGALTVVAGSPFSGLPSYVPGALSGSYSIAIATLP